MKKTVIALLFLLTGCTTSSGIVETGTDSYLISRDGPKLGAMKADCIKDAASFCKAHGKLVQVTASQDIPAGWSSAHSEVQFMCLAEGDSRLKGGPLVPVSPAPADKVMNGK